MYRHHALVIATCLVAVACSGSGDPANGGDPTLDGLAESSGWHQLDGFRGTGLLGIDGLQWLYPEGLIVDGDHLKLVYQTAVQSQQDRIFQRFGSLIPLA